MVYKVRDLLQLAHFTILVFGSTVDKREGRRIRLRMYIYCKGVQWGICWWRLVFCHINRVRLCTLPRVLTDPSWVGGSPFLPTWLSDDSDLWTLQDIPSSFIHLLRLASLHVTPEAKEVWLKVSWPSLASSSGDGAAPSRSALAQGWLVPSNVLLFRFGPVFSFDFPLDRVQTSPLRCSLGRVIKL